MNSSNCFFHYLEVCFSSQSNFNNLQINLYFSFIFKPKCFLMQIYNFKYLQKIPSIWLITKLIIVLHIPYELQHTLLQVMRMCYKPQTSLRMCETSRHQHGFEYFHVVSCWIVFQLVNSFGINERLIHMKLNQLLNLVVKQQLHLQLHSSKFIYKSLSLTIWKSFIFY